MKVSYNWLTDYLDIPIDLQSTCSALTSTGLEVEGVVELFSAFDHLVIGKVVDCYKHPNADKLRITKVDVGDSVQQIICGADNIRKNLFVAVVLPGYSITNFSGDSFKIKKTKIRGEVSEGMICSESEIGISSDHNGIMEISGNPRPGTLVGDWLKLTKDYIIEIGLTPNRTDAFSHIGVCKDLYAYLLHRGYNVQLTLPSVGSFNSSSKLTLPIKVKNHDSCPKYMGICIENITVKDSPLWLKNKLMSIGLKPINNVVDITNFILHETGNPLHAFDYDQISGKQIIVRNAENGEEFETLDSKLIKLSNSDLVICDVDKPLCLAGVMGGKKSGVSFNTKNLFLESAFFNPASIRKTSKKHSISTDSSYRFERGVDVNNCSNALQRATLLIKELCGGQIGQDFEFSSTDIQCKKINFSYSFCDKVLGFKIERSVIKNILTSLDFNILNSTESYLEISVPSSRFDVYREIDVVEEVLRIYGYDELPASDYVKFKPLIDDSNTKYNLTMSISKFLSSNGFFEIKNNSLSKESGLNLFSKSSKKNTINLFNPLSQDLSTMRTNMFFGGLETIKYNLNRQVQSLKLFEFGKTYSLIDGQYLEKEKLTLLSCGVFQGDGWSKKSEPVSFFLIKGIVAKLLDKFLDFELNLEVKQSNTDYSKKCLIYSVQNQQMIEIGEFSRHVLGKMGIKCPVYYVDIDFHLLNQYAIKKHVQYRRVSKYPSVTRDLSLLVDKSVKYLDLENSVKKLSSKLLKDIILFDVYEGDKIKKNKKSLAISFVFRNNESTLKDSEVDKEILNIYNYLVSQFNVSLREGELTVV